MSIENIPYRMLAPAKLTLSLRVLGRTEAGMHLIDAEMVSLDFSDTVQIEEIGEEGEAGEKGEAGGTGSGAEAAGSRIQIEGEGADTIPENNLVSAALDLAEKKAIVRIQKSIPPGAGLGGGSSNAAAVLYWAGFEDAERAAAIGADVAFCLRGGRARVSGIGEIVEPLKYREAVYTLFIPPFGCATKEVYEAWDSLEGSERLGRSQSSGGLPSSSEQAKNDLEPAALAVYPELADFRDRLAQVCGRTPRLAGSGSAWFVEGNLFEEASPEELEDLEKLTQSGGGKLLSARTVPARA